MIDFLLAVLLICGILAIPPLRRIAIYLIGGVVILFVVIMVATPAYRPAHQTLTHSEAEAAATRRKAAADAQAADAASKHLIAPGEIEIRRLWLTSFGRPLDLILSSLDDVSIAAIVRNQSPRYTLTEIAITADLFDCPGTTPGTIVATIPGTIPDAIQAAIPAVITAPGPQCDQIGQFEDHIRAVIPPGQVREMIGSGLGTIRNLPPLRGHLVLRHSIGWVRAAVPGSADTDPPDTSPTNASPTDTSSANTSPATTNFPAP